MAQSLRAVQVVLQAVPPALQPKLFGHCTGVSMQAPVASHVPSLGTVNWLLVQRFWPHVLPAGKTQAALVASQLVALQAGSLVAAQAALQQSPWPLMSQTCEMQPSFSTQAPAARRGAQTLLRQKAPVAQSLSALQLVLQASPFGSQPKLLGQGKDWLVVTEQFPEVSQKVGSSRPLRQEPPQAGAAPPMAAIEG